MFYRGFPSLYLKNGLKYDIKGIKSYMINRKVTIWYIRLSKYTCKNSVIPLQNLWFLLNNLVVLYKQNSCNMLYGFGSFFSYIPYYVKMCRKHKLNVYRVAVLQTVKDLHGVNIYTHTVFTKLKNSLHRKTIDKLLNDLIELGYINLNGKTYNITESGVMVLEAIYKDMLELRIIDRYEVNVLLRKSNNPPDSI